MSNPEGSTVIGRALPNCSFPSIHSEKGPGKRVGRVFFNDQMAFNRDVSVMLLAALPPARTALDAMASTGARAVRIAHEARPDLLVRGQRPGRPGPRVHIEANVELHRTRECWMHRNDDLRCILARRVFDYIDLDPFGTPVPFVPSIMQGLSATASPA